MISVGNRQVYSILSSRKICYSYNADEVSENVATHLTTTLSPPKHHIDTTFCSFRMEDACGIIKI